MSRPSLVPRSIALLLACAGCPSSSGTTSVSGTTETTSTGATTTNDKTTTSNGETTAEPGTTATSVGPASTSESSSTATTEDPDPTDTGESMNLKSSVTQYGVTWTFDSPHQVGQFVTGDWWVVGPVTIVSVDPAPSEGRNGSMLDPRGAQDYDSRAGKYQAGLRALFPLTLAGTRSLVSSISHVETPECLQGNANGWYTYNGECQRGPIATQAILTVVPEPQRADAFRPPYAGADKPIFYADDLCWDALPKLAPPPEAPDPEALLRHVERPWLDHLSSWEMQHGCATLNMFCYGREIGHIIATLAAYVLLDTPDQQELARRLVQLGIDNYGVVHAGDGWGADGGHFNGRKFPIVFAGALLGVPEMQSPGVYIGNEDPMTYYGAEDKALWGRVCDSCYLASGCDYKGECEGGAKDCRDPDLLVDGCDDYRNCCTSSAWVGEALAIHAMNQKSAWGHDAFFDYIDRWMSGDVVGGGATSNAFVKAMWQLYRDTPPAVTSCK